MTTKAQGVVEKRKETLLAARILEILGGVTWHGHSFLRPSRKRCVPFTIQVDTAGRYCRQITCLPVPFGRYGTGQDRTGCIAVNGLRRDETVGRDQKSIAYVVDGRPHRKVAAATAPIIVWVATKATGVIDFVDHRSLDTGLVSL